LQLTETPLVVEQVPVVQQLRDAPPGQAVLQVADASATRGAPKWMTTASIPRLKTRNPSFLIRSSLL